MTNFRVTSQSRAEQALRSLRKHNRTLGKYQEQIQTGLRINRPSDDPVKMRSLLAHRSDQQRIGSENNNIQAARLSLNNSVTHLLSAKDLVVEAKSVALSASPDMDRDLLSDQVKQISDQLLRVANAQLGDDYLFSGTSVSTKPFVVDEASNEIVYQGTEARQSIVVGRELTVNTSYQGGEIFSRDGTTIFQVLDRFRTALIDSPTLSEAEMQVELDEAIGQLDGFSDHFLDVVGEQSSTLRQLDELEVRNEDLQLELERVVTDISGADLAEAVVMLQNQQNLLQYTYATTARMFELSLMDYV